MSSCDIFSPSYATIASGGTSLTIFKKFLPSIALFVLISAFLYCAKDAYKSACDVKLAHFKSATELVSAIRKKEITSVDLLNHYLERIKRYNDDINAVVALDMDAARARAVEADKAVAQGLSWGPLHGLPMTVKDVFEVVGMPTTSGDPALKNYVPKQNAIAVQRLVDAGAIIFGKTNVPFHALDIQSYNQVYGTTNNPWDLTRTPGGSSGGSAAALAAGFTSLELGSDLGGSIRFPAHYTGVFGHKPSFGMVPRYGHIPPMPGQVPHHIMPNIPLFVVGPLARSADDLELALEVLVTPGSLDESVHRPDLLPPRRQNFRDYRVAVWFEEAYPAAEIDADVLAVLDQTVDRLKAAGLDIDEEARPGFDLWEAGQIWSEIYNQMMAGALPLDEKLAARQKKQQSRWADFFKHYDVLIAPVAPTVAFPHDHGGTLMTRTLKINGSEKPMLNNMAWAYMAIVSGLPATVAPVGWCDSGLPVGIQIIGAKLEDRTTIAFARGVSELICGFRPPYNYK
jgi:amidase